MYYFNSFWSSAPTPRITMTLIAVDAAVSEVTIDNYDDERGGGGGGVNDLIVGCAAKLNVGTNQVHHYTCSNRLLVAFYVAPPPPPQGGAQEPINPLASKLMSRVIRGPALIARMRDKRYVSCYQKEVEMLLGMWRLMPKKEVVTVVTRDSIEVNVECSMPPPTPAEEESKPSLLAIYKEQPYLKEIIERAYEEVREQDQVNNNEEEEEETSQRGRRRKVVRTKREREAPEVPLRRSSRLRNKAN
jgi:hypothetical protein